MLPRCSAAFRAAERCCSTTPIAPANGWWARVGGGSIPTSTSACCRRGKARRSEEHTSELQSLMRISYAVFCLKKKKNKHKTKPKTNNNNTQNRTHQHIITKQ